MRIQFHGIEVDVPQGWDGEIYRRNPEGLGGDTMPVMHLANFPLPSDRGDFGSGAVELMRSDGVLIALAEFGPDSVGTALFAREGFPVVRAEDFAPEQMQRPLPGQSGAQYFFTENGRSFCLYVALGSHVRRRELVPEVNQLLETVSVGLT